VHTAGFPQGDHARPRLGGDGLLDLFLVVATVREDDDLTRILSTWTEILACFAQGSPVGIAGNG
jgi:hypothetical protein